MRFFRGCQYQDAKSDLFVWGLNIVGCSSSIAAKKSRVSLFFPSSALDATAVEDSPPLRAACFGGVGGDLPSVFDWANP